MGGNVFDTYMGYSYASYGFVSLYSTTQTFSITGVSARYSGGGCSDTCRYAFDRACDDGGEGSEYSLCEIGTDCADCGGTRKATKQVAKHYDLEESGCKNTCKYSNDGDCDDGGYGADYDFCELGTDCADCGKGRSTLQDTTALYQDTYSYRVAEPAYQSINSYRVAEPAYQSDLMYQLASCRGQSHVSRRPHDTDDPWLRPRAPEPGIPGKLGRVPVGCVPRVGIQRVHSDVPDVRRRVRGVDHARRHQHQAWGARSRQVRWQLERRVFVHFVALAGGPLYLRPLQRGEGPAEAGLDVGDC